MIPLLFVVKLNKFKSFILYSQIIQINICQKKPKTTTNNLKSLKTRLKSAVSTIRIDSRNTKSLKPICAGNFCLAFAKQPLNLLQNIKFFCQKVFQERAFVKTIFSCRKFCASNRATTLVWRATLRGTQSPTQFFLRYCVSFIIEMLSLGKVAEKIPVKKSGLLPNPTRTPPPWFGIFYKKFQRIFWPFWSFFNPFKT